MSPKVKALIVGGVLLGLVGGAASSQATIPERTMRVTFSRAVALPGAELTAGTYIFELVSPLSSSNLVRVSSRDRHKVYLTAFTHLVSRPANLRPGHVVTLGEVPAGTAPRIKAWFPDGSDLGRQFIYHD